MSKYNLTDIYEGMSNNEEDLKLNEMDVDIDQELRSRLSACLVKIKNHEERTGEMFYQEIAFDIDNIIERLDDIKMVNSNLEEDSIEESIKEELAPTGIAITQKQLDDLERLGAISGLEVYVQDKDGSNVRKVAYTLTNTNFEKDINDIDGDDLDEKYELKEHFGRFMKDYQ